MRSVRSMAAVLGAEVDLDPKSHFDGAFGEDAIFSDQTIPLNKPCYVAVTVRLATAERAGEATFYVKDLSNDDEPLQIAKAPVRVTGGFANKLPLNLGGRSGRAGGFDGMIDDVRISNGALPREELLLTHETATEKTAGWWRFESKPGAFKDSSPRGNDIRATASSGKGESVNGARMTALADFCHVLLNANEFIYVD